jgi:hypothetical protein
MTMFDQLNVFLFLSTIQLLNRLTSKKPGGEMQSSSRVEFGFCPENLRGVKRTNALVLLSFG